MISYDDALLKAKEKKHSPIDNCTETQNAYIFGSHADDMNLGGEGPIVVMKESGKTLNMAAYLDTGSIEVVKEFEVK
jgi:hypothetical protein